MGCRSMKAQRVLYACVSVLEFPAQAVLRLRPELLEQACAILDGDPPLETVCSMNTKARKLGIVPGMTRVEAEILPAVALLTRSRGEEHSARTALLECAARFTPRVEECHKGSTFLCALDIAGTEQLFGKPAQLATSLIGCLKSVGLTASIAIAENFHTARCLVLARNHGMQLVSAGQEHQALAPLPLDVLDVTEQQSETFSNWGIRTLGELTKLPEASLVARIGQEGKRLRQMALGAWPHLFVPIEEELQLEELMDLDTPVELLDSLLFVLRILLERLITRAGNHLVALASISVTLKLDGGNEHRRTIRPAMASSDLQLWMKLAQLDLAAHPPQAAILGICLTGEPGSRGKVQLGLFTPQTPEPNRLDVTLARIRAIVGEDCIGMPVLKDTHRPDSFQIEPFRVSPANAEGQRAVESALTRGAIRMLRPAEPLHMTLSNRQPTLFFFRGAHYKVERAYGPWIDSGEWWNPTRWAIQQWDIIARANSDHHLCGCLAFEPLLKAWKMVGLYD
jgi:protein ImuB